MSTRKKARKPTKALVGLMELERRLHPHDLINGKPDRLTIDDRQNAARLLMRIIRDEDVRDDFFSAVKHRPVEDQFLKSSAAWVYHGRIALEQAQPGKKLRGEIAQLSGNRLTDKQVEHAAREFERSEASLAAGLSDEALQALVAINENNLRPKK